MFTIPCFGCVCESVWREALLSSVHHLLILQSQWWGHTKTSCEEICWHAPDFFRGFICLLFLSFLCKWGLVHSCGAAMVTQIIGVRRHITDVQLHACVIWLFKILLEFIIERSSQLKQHVFFITAASSTFSATEAVTIHGPQIIVCDVFWNWYPSRRTPLRWLALKAAPRCTFLLPLLF